MELRGFCTRMQRVGESAELMRKAAPEFPLDDDALRRRLTSRRRRLLLRLAARRASARMTEHAQAVHYWAEVAAAYERGRGRVRK
jgi:hypothetical protein